MCDPVVVPLLTTLGAPGAAASYAAMTGLQAAGLFASIGGTALSTIGAYNQAQVQKATAQNNAIIAERQAQDATERGARDAQDVLRKSAALKSSQRVALAAHGLELGYGTAADIQDQTDFFGASDAAMTKDNAAREAWSHRAQGASFAAEAKATRPWLSAGSTMLTGAGQVADRWYSYAGRNPGLSYAPSRLTAGLVM